MESIYGAEHYAWDLTSNIVEWVGEVNLAFSESRISTCIPMTSIFSSHEDYNLRVSCDYLANHFSSKMNHEV